MIPWLNVNQSLKDEYIRLISKCLSISQIIKTNIANYINSPDVDDTNYGVINSILQKINSEFSIIKQKVDTRQEITQTDLDTLQNIITEFNTIETDNPDLWQQMGLGNLTNRGGFTIKRRRHNKRRRTPTRKQKNRLYPKRYYK